ncbi:unnamed protein product [Timema podura]|uniref:Uncharacterized protein n=1 Tax=Timema podura TaxID=61482 RepID=A0ABN7P4R0_TIMPD|nr:unnamed protein product [Timema podura]
MSHTHQLKVQLCQCNCYDNSTSPSLS